MKRTRDAIATPYGTLSRELTEIVRQTRPELLCPQPRRTRSRRTIAATVGALVGAATITLLAASHAFAAPAGAVLRMAQEHHACAAVLGLDPSESPYQDCVVAVDRNLPPADPAQAAMNLNRDQTTSEKANAACADIGLDRGSAAFGRCVTDIGQALSDQQQIYR